MARNRWLLKPFACLCACVSARQRINAFVRAHWLCSAMQQLPHPRAASTVLMSACLCNGTWRTSVMNKSKRTICRRRVVERQLLVAWFTVSSALWPSVIDWPTGGDIGAARTARVAPLMKFPGGLGFDAVNEAFYNLLSNTQCVPMFAW